MPPDSALGRRASVGCFSCLAMTTAAYLSRAILSEEHMTVIHRGTCFLLVLIIPFQITACAPSPAHINSAVMTATVPAQVMAVKYTDTPTPERIVAAVASCNPTFDDGVNPTYRPGAPERNSVGHGHFMSGVVRSSLDCLPIAHARIEVWAQYAGESHPASARATLYSDRDGAYRFECDPPEHVHLRLSAGGYRTINNNSYHPNGKTEGRFDLVLAPVSQ